MVKKLLAMLTMLVLCMGCCAAFAQTDHEQENFLGYWQLTEIRLLGMTMPAESLERKGFISFHADGTAIFCLDEDAALSVKVTYADGVAKLEDESGTICTIGADGRLGCMLSADGISLDLLYSRTDYPALPALMASWPGEYELVSVSMGGLSLPESSLAQYDLWVYQDGYGMFRLGDVTATFRMWEENGVIRGIDADQAAFEAWTDEKGQLCIRVLEQGLTIVGRRLVPAEPAGVETPVTGNPFLGQWESVSAILLGMEFDMADLGLDHVSLRVEQDMAYLDLGGQQGSCPTLYEGETLVFTNGMQRVDCTMEDGWMYMTLNVDGTKLRLKMQRTDSAEEEPAVVEPAVEEPVTDVPAAEAPVAVEGFDGTWTLVQVERGGSLASASQLGLSGSLVVTGTSARYTLGDESVLGLVQENGTTLRLIGRSSYDFVLNAQGLLTLTVTSLGVEGDGNAVLIFSRDGRLLEASAADENVAEEPVPEVPVVEEPAAGDPVAVDGFDGAWMLVQVERGGSIVSAERLGLSGSLLVTGSSARYTFGDESVLGLVQENGAALKLVGRSSYVFTLNAQGLLTLPATVNGEAVVLRFSRDGMPVTEVSAAEESEAVEPAAEETVAELPAAVEGFDGTWKLVQVERHGAIVPASQLGLSGSMTVTGSSARYILGTENMLGLVTSTADGLTLYVQGGTMQFFLDGEGFLCRRMPMDGDMVVLRFYRGEMPAAAPEQPATGRTSGFDGFWQGMSVKVMGMDFTLEELGMQVLEVEISGSTGFLTDENGRRGVSVHCEEDRLVLTEGTQRWVLCPDGEGQAVVEMIREGITVQVLMKKTGSAPAAQPAATPAAELVACDFCGEKHDAAQSYTVVTMRVCPACYSRYFK